MRKESVVRSSFVLAAAVAFASIAVSLPALARTEQWTDEEGRRHALTGLNLMMNGDLGAAIEVFQRIQRNDPQSPLGYILEADAAWWRIYYDSANLIDPDVFGVADMEATPYDAHFNDLVDAAIRKAEARIKAKEDVARSHLYEGYAYALRARFEGLHDRDLPTARAGKKMRAQLLRALALNANLTDAYLGLGIYNYFVDTLSTIVKILSIFIGLPGGSRTEGLRQLELCAEKGELGRAEAKFYLGKDYSRASEKQYEKSLRYFRELHQEYPDNPLWPMLTGSLNLRLRRPQQGEAIYREVYQQTAGKTSDVNVAVHRAAGQALERLHPDQKFP
jgi:tetratricopeptide (TPR) repeat protein